MFVIIVKIKDILYFVKFLCLIILDNPYVGRPEGLIRGMPIKDWQLSESEGRDYNTPVNHLCCLRSFNVNVGE